MKNIEVAVILCGGLGTRLRGVYSLGPKPMVKIEGRPYLEWLVRDLLKKGLNKIFLSVSYKKEVIMDHFSRYPDLQKKIEYVVEKELLGTAGAMKLCFERVSQDHCFFLNGDSYVNFNPLDFILDKSSLGVIGVSKGFENNSEYGSINLNADGSIDSFDEKNKSKSKLINAGVYLFHKKFFKELPLGKKCSLEKEWIPMLLKNKIKIMAHILKDSPLDIGTPGRLKLIRENSKSVDLFR